MRLILAILALTMLCGCSAFDYLQYRENTGLMVIEKPDGYGSARFGERLAVSSTSDKDLMAVSAGLGHTTLFYQLAEDGKIDNLENAIPGDLLFFINKEKKVSHTGIYLGNGKIIHASASVRLDVIDKKGIYNAEMKAYTHKLYSIRRCF